MVNHCLYGAGELDDLVGDDIGFFVFVEEPGGAVDEAVGELGGDGGFWDVVAHESGGVGELDADGFFVEWVVGERGV